MNTVSEMKNTLKGIRGTLDKSEEWISDLEDKIAENTKSEQQKEKRIFKNKVSLMDLWDIKCNNICIIGAPERE